MADQQQQFTQLFNIIEDFPRKLNNLVKQELAETTRQFSALNTFLAKTKFDQAKTLAKINAAPPAQKAIVAKQEHDKRVESIQRNIQAITPKDLRTFLKISQKHLTKTKAALKEYLEAIKTPGVSSPEDLADNTKLVGNHLPSDPQSSQTDFHQPTSPPRDPPKNSDIRAPHYPHHTSRKIYHNEDIHVQDQDHQEDEQLQPTTYSME